MWGPRGEQFLSERNFEVLAKLEPFAESRGHTMLELAFGWLLSQPFIPSVIAGATTPEQVEQNVASSSWKLTQEEMDEVNGLTQHGG
jgi:aryl-alcohol dehydrogenase-like predicted oxidoreductase